MLNRYASLTMSTSVLKALPGKLDIKRHSPSVLYVFAVMRCVIKGQHCILHNNAVSIQVFALLQVHALQT